MKKFTFLGFLMALFLSYLVTETVVEVALRATFIPPEAQILLYVTIVLSYRQIEGIIWYYNFWRNVLEGVVKIRGSTSRFSLARDRYKYNHFP